MTLAAFSHKVITQELHCLPNIWLNNTRLMYLVAVLADCIGFAHRFHAYFPSNGGNVNRLQ